MTGFGPIAPLAIVTGTVIRHVVTTIGRLVTAIGGTGHAVTAIGFLTALAAQGVMTSLGPIAPLAVVTGTVIRHVVTTIGRLVTAIGGTGHAVTAVRRIGFLTTVSGITGLGPIAEESIVTG
jgi:hypothetical protein